MLILLSNGKMELRCNNRCQSEKKLLHICFHKLFLSQRVGSIGKMTKTLDRCYQVLLLCILVVGGKFRAINSQMHFRRNYLRPRAE